MRYKVNMMKWPRPTVYILYRVKNSLCENCTARVEWPRLRKQPNQYPYVLSPQTCYRLSLYQYSWKCPLRIQTEIQKKIIIFTKISRYIWQFFPWGTKTIRSEVNKRREFLITARQCSQRICLGEERQLHEWNAIMRQILQKSMKTKRRRVILP